MKNFLLLLPLCAFLACDKSNDDPAVYRVGDTIDLPGSNNLELTGVEDSRCPCDAVCIWEGTAIVSLVNGTDTIRVGTASLNGEPSAETTYRGSRIKLLDVSPYPCLADEVKQADYRVTLEVDR